MKEHPDYWKTDGGTCDHKWLPLGNSWFRCTRCGQEEEA